MPSCAGGVLVCSCRTEDLSPTVCIYEGTCRDDKWNRGWLVWKCHLSLQNCIVLYSAVLPGGLGLTNYDLWGWNFNKCEAIKDGISAPHEANAKTGCNVLHVVQPTATNRIDRNRKITGAIWSLQVKQFWRKPKPYTPNTSHSQRFNTIVFSLDNPLWDKQPALQTQDMADICCWWVHLTNPQLWEVLGLYRLSSSECTTRKILFTDSKQWSWLSQVKPNKPPLPHTKWSRKLRYGNNCRAALVVPVTGYWLCRVQ